jgi:hypothetical protein
LILYCLCLAILESFTIEFGFFGFTAFRATLRFVLKSFLSVEFLFAVGEREFLVAISADDVFVGHVVSPVFIWGSNILGLSRKHKEWALGNVESLLFRLCLNTHISVNTFLLPMRYLVDLCCSIYATISEFYGGFRGTGRNFHYI